MFRAFGVYDDCFNSYGKFCDFSVRNAFETVDDLYQYICEEGFEGTTFKSVNQSVLD